MKTCKDCKWYKSCMDICELSPQNCFVFEQRTNFDKVTVSPEELGRFINKKIDQTLIYNRCPFSLKDSCPVDIGCGECIAKWLKQEAEDDVADNDE